MKSFKAVLGICLAGAVLVSCQDGNKKQLASTIAANTAIETLASQGGESSGGGGGFYCADDTAELLDLWEGRYPSMYNYTIPTKAEDVNTQLIRALANLNSLSPAIATATKRNIEDLMKSARAIDPSGELAPPQDADPLMVKPKCRLRGIMYYDGERKILWYDQFMISRLSKTDEAALWFHEGLYKVMRDRYGEKNSKATRQVVACSFSSAGCFDKLLTLERLLPSNRPVYRCYNDLSTYYFYQGPNAGMTLVLSRSKGRELTYPWYWMDSEFPMPSIRVAKGLTNHEPGKGSGSNAKVNFQGFEKTNISLNVQGMFFPSRGGILPTGLSAPFDDIGEDLFGKNTGNTNCEQINGISDPVSGDPSHPISGDPTYPHPTPPPVSSDPTHPIHPPISSDPSHPISNDFTTSGQYTF